MSSQKQKKLAKQIAQDIANGTERTDKDLVTSVGYSEITADAHSKRTLESQGLKDELEKLGINLDEADSVVRSILKSPTVYEMVTPDNQLRAADMIYKRLGAYAASDKKPDVNVVVPILVKFIDGNGNRNTSWI